MGGELAERDAANITLQLADIFRTSARVRSPSKDADPHRSLEGRVWTAGVQEAALDE